MADERLGIEGDGRIPESIPGESRFVAVNDVCLHVVDAGPIDGPPVVLLHGFPEFWYGWHEQVAPLADAGCRVIVPDQRGYNLSEKPTAVASYHVAELARDVVGLVEAVGAEAERTDDTAAVLVGHDWGAGVGWWTAIHHPEHVAGLLAVNGPHPAVFESTLRRSWRQRRRSWYIGAFQLPSVPERVASLGEYAVLVWGMRRSSLPGTFDSRDFDRFREAWDRPRAMRAMIDWYRAIGRFRPRPETETVTVPTHVLWATDDRYLATSMAAESVARCPDGELTTIEDATHWLHHERPDAVRAAFDSLVERTREDQGDFESHRRR